MNRKRLNDLKTVLIEDHPEVSFDMRCWCIKKDCKTTACAAGLYISEMKPKDLFLVLKYRTKLEEVYTIKDINGLTDMIALECHFGLDHIQTCRIFLSGNTKEDVIRHIDEVIDEH
jgi:hypothetical protein